MGYAIGEAVRRIDLHSIFLWSDNPRQKMQSLSQSLQRMGSVRPHFDITNCENYSASSQSEKEFQNLMMNSWVCGFSEIVFLSILPITGPM